MKLVKLWMHQKNFSEDELVLNPKDFDAIKLGDVVEIYHLEDDYSRLLLQVKSLHEDFQPKDTVSVAQSIATSFHLRMYKEVYISVVNPKDVALDLLELTYKDQYFNRADMFRMRKSLLNSCVYLGMKVKFVEMRGQVEELWAKGDKVRCGYLTEDTRVTYRSSTAQVNIFIQMSSEMWEFDNYGDLYFEKAVDGFLVDLFRFWKDNNCSHDVTITMFSRTFYDVKNLENIPLHMRECVQQDCLGRFYEDFYRVVVQNERYDDWTSTVIQLKTLFNTYREQVLNIHKREDTRVPKARNSSAAHGNFLEVLNMALNVFEKYYLDRSFDRTGKVSILITPGSGVFEVDRELSTVTKLRTIDCGNGSDLVCLGEQPLHAVPLFKFYNKNPSTTHILCDDYNIPHWINHSFYTSKAQSERISKGTFIPRIRMVQLSSPDHSFDDSTTSLAYSPPQSAFLDGDDVPFVDYDDYDAEVFKLPSYRSVATSPSTGKMRKSSTIATVEDIQGRRRKRVRYTACIEGLFNNMTPSSRCSSSKPINIPKAKQSEEFMSNSFDGKLGDAYDDVTVSRLIVGSCGSPVGHQSRRSLICQPRRTLINPFAPSRLHFKVTSNRRRWAHAFPTDPQGASVQHHHQQRITSQSAIDASYMETTPTPTREVVQAAQLAVEIRKQRCHMLSLSEGSDETSRAKSVTISTSVDSSDFLRDSQGRGLKKVASNGTLGTLALSDSTSSVGSMTHSSERGCGSVEQTRSLGTPGWSSLQRDMGNYTLGKEGHNWLWGVTGEQEWTPEIKTGMDWKAVGQPASLPLTTDYFPDKSSLKMDYVMSDYSLIPEEINSEIQLRSTIDKFSTPQVFQEMIYQRLAQGFQIVLLPKSTTPASVTELSCSSFRPYSSLLRTRTRHKTEPMDEIILSIGRIYHKLSMNGPTITVSRYWPRHPYRSKNYHYTYRFQVPDSENYDVSWTDFFTEKLENYNWNYIDHYICCRAEEDLGRRESLKYWRARFFLLPCNNAATKMIMDGSERCDLYDEKSVGEQVQLIDSFMRFIETLNKIRRPLQNRKTKKELARRGSFTLSPGSFCVSQEKDKIDLVARAKALTPVGRTQEGADGASSTVSSSYVNPSVGPKCGHAGCSEVGHVSGCSRATDTSTGSSDRTGADGITLDTSLVDIVAAMLDPSDGLNFLNKQQGLPSLPTTTFVSHEAVVWAMSNIDGVNSVSQAVELFQSMVDEQLIIHASGNKKNGFIYGFYLYAVVSQDSDNKDPTNESFQMGYGYNRSFQYEWCEVKFQAETGENQELEPIESPRETSNIQPQDSASPFHNYHGSPRYQQVQFADSPGRSSHSSRTSDLTIDMDAVARRYASVYKLVNVYIDPAHKSDREERGSAYYHSIYNPNTAFEIEVQWLVASGCILGELVWSWARKAGSCGFHFLPVPIDPFALPFTHNSDPLRGPIFVPIKTECLTDFPEETRQGQVLLFQDSILKRFGFMPSRAGFCRHTIMEVVDEEQPQYVHCTGGMFCMIPDTRAASPLNQDGTHRPLLVGSHKDYIAQRSRPESLCETSQESFYRVGFLWSWNYMLSKRWRSSSTGDEALQDKMLRDFRAFCSNSNNRLQDYWDNYRQKVLASESFELRTEIAEPLSEGTVVTITDPGV